jgi:hypothetical protein
MALTELVSNLAAGLYGAPTPSQFVMPIGPGSSNTPTDAVTFATTNNGSLFYIQNSGNGISRRIAQGFNNLGYLAFFGNKQSKDFFPLFTALGESGTSRRMSQGGIGFPFPIGPTGNVYDWKPNAHTGWNINNRYNDTTNKTSTIGLADTYTTNSPIDDIYNKVKVRSAAWNKNSFGLATDQPFILRGIQRDNNSDPQYWGAFNNPNMNVDTISDTPRGGLLTAIEREAIDKARIGKFLISPKGIFFAVKQLGLQASNPNVEGFTGTPSYNPIFNTKLWNPLSLFSLNAPVPYHITRHGIPGDPTGLSAYGYEKTVTTFRRASPLAVGKNGLVIHNRLVKLESEAFGSLTDVSIGSSYNTLGGFPNPLGSKPTAPYIGGPKSFLGLGFTNQRRYTNTSLKQSSLTAGAPGLDFIKNPFRIFPLATGRVYDNKRYLDTKPYITTREVAASPLYTIGSDDTDWSKRGLSKIQAIVNDTAAGGNQFLKSKWDRQQLLLKKWEDSSTGTYKPFELYTDTLNYLHQSTGKNYIPGEYDDDWSEAHKVERRSAISQDVQLGTFDGGGTAKDLAKAKYTTLAYGKLPDALASSYNDFRIGISDADTKTFISNSPEEYATKNINTRLGMPNYADPTLDRSDPKKRAVSSGDTSISTDLVKFRITAAGLGTLRFRAYIKSISNSWNVNSEDGTRFAMAQVVKEKKYTGLDHQISVDFSAPILSKAELTDVLDRLDLLAKIFYGEPDKKDASTRTMVLIDKLVIGKYLNTRAYITSLSYDIDNETTWDIDNETPMLVNVSISFTEAPVDITSGATAISATSADRIIYHP